MSYITQNTEKRALGEGSESILLLEKDCGIVHDPGTLDYASTKPHYFYPVNHAPGKDFNWDNSVGGEYASIHIIGS